MAVSSAGLRPKSHCSCKAQKQLYEYITANPLVREGAPLQETRNRQKENRNLVMGSRWESDTKTDWPTDRRSQHNFNFNGSLNRELLQLKDGTVWETRRRGTSAIGSRYQNTGEDTANSKDLSVWSN
jgi:hypothetical protein